jgi:hypothetical protein
MTASAIKHAIILIIASSIAVWVAFQSRIPMTVDIAADTGKHIAGFFEIQAESTRSYRWTKGDAGRVTFFDPGIVTPLTIQINASAWRNETRVYTATVLVNGVVAGTIERAGWRNWGFTITDPSVLRADMLTVEFDSQTFVPAEIWSDATDQRELGLAVERVQVMPASSAGWITPAPMAIIFAILAVLGVYFFLCWVGLERFSLPASIAVLVSDALLIVFVRDFSSQRIFFTALLTGSIVLIAMWVDGSMLQRRAPVWVIPALVAFAALLLRWHAALTFPGEGDEGIYSRVAAHYAQAIHAGNLTEIATYDHAMGHPIFYELAYAVGLLIRNSLGIPLSDLMTLRALSTGLGTLHVGLMTFINPIAGWFLATQTTQIKFTSLVYLEALPALASTIAVIGYERFRRTADQRWFYLSAIALGATGASKFIYVNAGLAIFLFLFWEQRRQPKTILLYVIIAGATFFALDPYLWSDPVGRLSEMLSFHAANTQGEYVKYVNRPWWYLFASLVESAKLYTYEQTFPPPFYFVPDAIIFVLGILGISSLGRRGKIYVAWPGFGVLFMAFYPVKWEQYAMIIVTPMCWSAGAFVTDAFARVRQPRGR